MLLILHYFKRFITSGMSESSGPQTVCKMAPNYWNSASAGKDIVGVRTKIMDPDADGEGEVCKL